MDKRLVSIRAAQIGRHSKDGPQPGQKEVAMAAFLIARSDIDYLLGEVDRASVTLREMETRADCFEAKVVDAEAERDDLRKQLADIGAENKRLRAGLDITLAELASARGLAHDLDIEQNRYRAVLVEVANMAGEQSRRLDIQKKARDAAGAAWRGSRDG